MGDAFEMLGIARSFRVERGEVERAYLSRAAEAHPDLVGGDDEAARRMAALNEAKGTLLDPERRAAALLASLGGAGGETDRSLPDGFLMEMMETRERMEEELSAGDESTRRKSAESWERWGREKRDEAIGRAGEMFERAMATSGAERAGTLGEIRTHLNAWRYVERLLEQARGARPM